MKFYAQLNENNICIGISQLSGEVKQENMIEIESLDNDLMWRKYEHSEWSTVKFEPESTAPITEFEALKSDYAELSDAVAEILMGV